MALKKYDVISVRFPVGTVRDISNISKKLYFGRSVSDYVKEAVLTNIKLDKSVTNQIKGVEKNGESYGSK